ncbi:hypothetical protein Q5530_25660 [Saccharothrix sp. BKS2]|uniref:hypothetical protein n=1 Tax=Saccharothrix sp. BKS2 TaxID=3064400 RepID=UPI0039E8FFBF
MLTAVRSAAAALAVAAGLTVVTAPAATAAPRVLYFSDLDRCRVAQLNYARSGWFIRQGCTADVHVNGKPARWRLMVE